MSQLLQLVEERKNAKFFPKAQIRFEYYDCVTFALDLYQELNVLPKDSKFPDYGVYTRGKTMLDLIKQWVEESEAFSEATEPSPGALVVASRGTRGHHVGVYLGDDLVAHCSKFKNVKVEAYSTGIFGPYINIIYKPHGME